MVTRPPTRRYQINLAGTAAAGLPMATVGRQPSFRAIKQFSASH
jgi:hypothetical protein